MNAYDDVAREFIAQYVAPLQAQLLDEKRQHKVAKQYLRALCKSTARFLALLDAEMQRPSDAERGRRIAAMANDLDLHRQMAERFGLPKSARRATGGEREGT